MAISAALCTPHPSVAITGDMGLWMALGELGVVTEQGLDVTVVYLADRSLSLIELKQERGERTGGGVRFTNPDVAHLAAAFGGTHCADLAGGVEAMARLDVLVSCVPPGVRERSERREA